MSEILAGKRARAGQKGGQTTLARYGQSYFVEIGHLGGRPGSLTLAELQQQQALQDKEREKGGMATNGSNNLRVLKRLYQAEQRSRENESLIKLGEANLVELASPEKETMHATRDFITHTQEKP
jgi:hypothetical protein